jgi:hypothetical protein
MPVRNPRPPRHTSETMDDDNSGNDTAVEVDRWIGEQLAEAGFSDHDVAVAIEERLDWRTMVRLREGGCPPELALEIVK